MTSLVATMNNNGPHDPRPFGYTFNYADTFADASDIPVNGPPLLNNNENTFLGDFFGNPAGFQFDFGFNLPLQNAGQHEADLNWLMNEPAPTLLQATAAAPKISSPPTNQYQPLMAPSSFFSGISDNLAMGAQDEILHANTMAAMHQSPVHMSPHLVSGPSMAQQHMDNSRSQHPTTNTMSSDYNTHHSMHGASTSPHELIFPHSFRIESTGHPAVRLPHAGEETTDARLYRFGSDAHFTGDGFRALHENETNTHIEKTLLQDLYLIHPVSSNANTRPPSRDDSDGSRKRSQDHDGIEPALKRRKGTGESNGSGPQTHERRKSSVNQDSRSSNAPKPRRTSSMESSSGAAARRRRSSHGAAAAKAAAARENLSEEQKRSNHIMSEQKRRNLIKTGFEELHILVPELRQGGLSKSNVLVETANFLDRILAMNKDMMLALGVPL